METPNYVIYGNQILGNVRCNLYLGKDLCRQSGVLVGDLSLAIISYSHPLAFGVSTSVDDTHLVEMPDVLPWPPERNHPLAVNEVEVYLPNGAKALLRRNDDWYPNCTGRVYVDMTGGIITSMQTLYFGAFAVGMAYSNASAAATLYIKDEPIDTGPTRPVPFKAHPTDFAKDYTWFAAFDGLQMRILRAGEY